MLGSSDGLMFPPLPLHRHPRPVYSRHFFARNTCRVYTSSKCCPIPLLNPNSSPLDSSCTAQYVVGRGSESSAHHNVYSSIIVSRDQYSYNKYVCLKIYCTVVALSTFFHFRLYKKIKMHLCDVRPLLFRINFDFEYNDDST